MVRQVRLLSGLLLAMLLGGCSVLDLRQKVPPTVVPPERIARLVQLLNDEWVRWGRAMVLLDGADGSTCLARPDGTCVNVEVGCGQEQTPALCPVVNDYWAAAGSPPRNLCVHTAVCEATRPPGAAFHANSPWSAAFVSAMMERAGFSPSEFARGISHATYLLAAREGFASSYEVVPTPAEVLPGDLVCAGRGDNLVTPADLPRVNTVRFPMHCDVVVHVDPFAMQAEVIGGNVQQTVAKSVVPLDPLGRVLFEPGASRAWAFVMKARRTLPAR